jgi:hypothetical protein
METLAENRREMKDTNERVTEWIGILMKSELLRREMERNRTDDKPERMH